ncbi:MAG: hypothetical protein OXR73_34560 [Myxococcales bacterium]|nr:hypothetical protein [Myxococcales bacterium]
MNGSTALDSAQPARARRTWDRFAHWPASRARVALVVLVAMLVAAALTPLDAGDDPQDARPHPLAELVAGDAGPDRRDDDLLLYDAVIERLQNGERYYDFIVEEHRKRQYAVTPGVAVRLPTLAYIDAWLGPGGQMAVSLALLLSVLAAWWRRLAEEPGGLERRRIALALVFMGTSLCLNRHYFVMHELWAGALLALSFGLHGPGRWGASLAAAALALFIRELCLPFVLLMAAVALYRRDWSQSVAWSMLALCFLMALSAHSSAIAARSVEGDHHQSWLTLRGLPGFLTLVVHSSSLRVVPEFLAAPIVMLAIVGWLGWRSPAGVFGSLLYLGYGVGFMIAGRPDNFYWGVLIVPVLFVGLAFMPRAVTSLVEAAAARSGGTTALQERSLP